MNPFLRNHFKSILFATCLSLLATLNCRAAGEYRFLRSIDISGGGNEGKMTLDEEGRRLFVPLSKSIAILDLGTEKIIGQITNVFDVHSFVLVPKFRLGYCSNAKDNKMNMMSLPTFKTGSEVKTGSNPGAILYLPGRESLYTLNRGENSVSVYEADDGDFLMSIPLPGKPLSAVCDPKAQKLYCISDGNDGVTVIDCKTHKVVDSWPLMTGAKPAGVAIDADHQRLFVICKNKLLLMMDSVSGKLIDTAATGPGTSRITYDSSAQLIFGFCSDGNMVLVHEDTAEKLNVVQTVKSIPAASDIIVDPSNHNLYLLMYQPSQDQSKPDSLSAKVMVYGRN